MLWQVSQDRFPLRINAFISYGAGTEAVVVDCHDSTFHLEDVYFFCHFYFFLFFGCQHLPPSVRLLLTNIDWAVSDFLAGCAPLHRQPHLSALLLSLLCASAHCSRSGLWPGRDFFLTAYACAHRAERFVWKSWKKKWRKGKEEIGSICICMCLFVSAVGLHIHRYLSFFCCCPASINSSFPVQSNPRVLVLVGLFLPSASSPTFTLSRPVPVCLYIRQTRHYRASSLLTSDFLWCRSGTVNNRVFFPPFFASHL